jgi:hypothetical protein
MATEAQQLLQQVVARYAAFVSYADEGTVRTRVRSEEPELITTFSTLISKPACFRFEFRRPHPYPPLRHIVHRHLVVSDGSTVQVVRDNPGQPLQIDTSRSLELAVAGATGISSGSAHTIARLLLPQVGGLSLLELVDAQLRPDVSLGSAVCYQVEAKFPRSGGLATLCIEKDTLLIRRFGTARDRFPDEQARENIRVNEPIEADLFRAEVAAPSVIL